jgi:hypothetical protein
MHHVLYLVSHPDTEHEDDQGKKWIDGIAEICSNKTTTLSQTV